MSTAPSDLQRQSIGEAEWQTRVELAACYRLFVNFGWTDLIFTHLSARVPGRDDQYLINPFGLLFQEITASNLIVVDFDGNLISGDYPVNDAGHAIHSTVLKARPDVDFVLHSHTRAGMAISCMACGLLPLTQQANELRDLVCYHDYGVVDDEEVCIRLGEDLGDKWLMFMRNHGLLAVGKTIAQAFYYLYTLENACKVQVDVMACGVKTVTPNQRAIEQLAKWGHVAEDAPVDFATVAWDALIRMLDVRDPSYKH